MMQNRIRGTAVFSQKEKGVFGGWKMWLPARNDSLSHAPPPLEPGLGEGGNRITSAPSRVRACVSLGAAQQRVKVQLWP